VSGKQRSILVVEDDTDIRESLRELLEEQQFVVLCAENGEVALSVLRATTEPPLFILLDLTMPVMNGFAFREAQLADPALASIPVVMMTASGAIEAKRRQLACEHALKKPMSVQALLDVVAALA
jgi:CheY-like chemotaxis protein